MARPGVNAVLTSGLAAQLAAATVGALPWWVLPITAAGYVASGVAASRAEGRKGDLLRSGGTALALVASVALAPALFTDQGREAVKVILGLLLVVTQSAQALGWRATRDLRSGLIVNAGLLVLAASYAPDVLVGVPLLVGWAALVSALAQLTGVRRAEVTRATAMAVVLGLVAFLLVPAEPSEGLRSRLAQLSANGGTRDRAGVGAFTSDRLDLRQRGSLPATPVAYVPLDSPQLWRSTVYPQYDGQGWRRSRRPQTVARDVQNYQVATTSKATRLDEVQLADGRQSFEPIWAPGPIVSVQVGREVRRATVDVFGEVTLQGLDTQYRVESEVPVTDPDLLASTQGPDIEDRRWRELPVSLPERVRALSRRLAAGQPNRYAIAAAVSDYLRENATYRLDSPVPLPGEDAVDRFLFVDRVGFCEQFASAQVVLLRAAGIPARLVTGLAYGEKQGDRRLFRVANRHAWVELWIPGTGWVSSDPTPASGRAAADLSLRSRVAGNASALLQGLTRVPGGRPVVALGLLALAVVVGVLVGRKPRAIHGGRVVAALARSAPGPALAAFTRWDARQLASRLPHESLRELSDRVAEPGVREALRVVEEECYAASAPEIDQVRQAIDEFER